MMDEDPVKTVNDSVSIVAEVLKAAGDAPQVKEAAGNLGQTAVTLTKAINNVLLPLAAVNFAFDKARAYYNSKFQQDLAEKTKDIPPEHIVEPKASIAGPTLQGLAFTHEEPNLKEMYLNLLATSMDGRAASFSHPAFVEIIKQLDSEDARLVRITLKSIGAIPVIQIHRILNASDSYNLLAQHIVDLTDDATGTPIEDPDFPAMVDNWIRLGLVEVNYDRHLTDLDRYSWAEKRPEFLRWVQATHPDEGVIECRKGIMRRTELGKRFARAVGLIDTL